MIGQSIDQLMPPDCRDELVDSFQRIRTNKLVDHFESKCVSKNGRILDVSVTIVVLPANGDDG